MKRILVITLLFISNLLAQQYYYTFSELKGMEDQLNNTHLFYRLFYYNENPVLSRIENSIYHWDLNNNLDTLFLFDGGWLGDFTENIIDIAFWNNNPSEFIYVGAGCGVDCDVFIKRFDDEFPSLLTLGFGNFEGIEISGQDDSLVFATVNFNIKSTDGGRNWDAFDSTYKGIVSINPFNDDLFFADFSSLYKSTDGGLNFSIVDTSSNFSHELFYDKDSIHIYNLLNNRIRVSDNRGNAFSWTEKYSSTNPIYISVDYSQSGSIYPADGRYIYHSTDYGTTFNEYKVLDRKIVGLYKKPSASGGSDKLYAATKYDLYEITPDTILTIKHLAVDPDLFAWYPLEVGNKWIYNYWWELDSLPEIGISVTEITGDTIVNGKHYFIFNNSNNYIRLDSLTGRIYKTNNPNIHENLFTDLTLDVGDTLYDSTNYQRLTVTDQQPFNQWGLNTPQKFFNDFSTSITHTFSFVKEIGLYNEFIYELGGGEITLKGAVIDGIIYGDTTTVGVNDLPQQVNEFSLSQNYPNPFNPTTKIEFRIANFEFVSLKVFDVLGREVATLINEEKSPGVYEVEFDPSGIMNLASGIYFYKLQTDNYTSTKKMIYLK